MEFQRQYDEFGGKRKEEYLMGECWVGKGVLMVMEGCEMKLRGANLGQQAPTGIQKPLSSHAAHP